MTSLQYLEYDITQNHNSTPVSTPVSVSVMATSDDYDVTTDDVNFRKATAADYDDVMSLRPHLYHGMDYLPSQYHHLLHTHTGFCGFIGNQMVGFILAIIIDDGETIVIRAGRVRKEHENKGIYSRLRKFCLSHFPRTVKRESFSLFSSDHKDSSILKGGILAWQRERITLTAGTATIKNIIKSVTVTNALRVVNKSLLSELFSSKSSPQLFPGDFIVVNSVPYKVRMSNISYFLTPDRVMYASYSESVKSSNSPPPVLVSVANQIRCEAGTRFNIDFYGDICVEEDVTNHIISQMARCLSECADNILMYVTYPMNRSDAILMSVLDKLRWKVKLRGYQYGIEQPVSSD
ncbi:probable N-acetyltransferase 16 [Argopecten irradians]|uniref:probable N-acetyltransferase 16 n=1 Tax=Argopecten irradians TaxID=31199 RepID=UPI003716805A